MKAGTKQRCDQKECPNEKNRGGYRFTVGKGYLAEIEGGEGRDPRHFKELVFMILASIIIIVILLVFFQPSVTQSILQKISQLLKGLTAT